MIDDDLRRAIAQAEATTNLAATDPQRQAGNYRKGRFR